MKKWISIFLFVILVGCRVQEKPKLYVFVNETCGECQQLKTDFLPKLDDESIEIVILDMDHQDSINQYKDMLDRLDNIDMQLYEQLITPFIYLEGGFGAVGYHEVMEDIYLQLIQEAINHQAFEIVPSGVYLEKGE